MRSEMVISEDVIEDRSEAWWDTLGSARLMLATTAGRRWSLKTHLARLEHHGEQLTKIEGQVPPHHETCGGIAPRFARWRAPDRRTGEAAKAGFPLSQCCAIGRQQAWIDFGCVEKAKLH